MKRAGIIVFVSLITLALFTMNCEEVEFDQSIDFSEVKSGTYTGSQKWPLDWKKPLTIAEVKVIVEQPKVININLTKFECGLGKKAKQVVDSIIQKQSLQIDGVSGATISSKCILKATEIALKKGL